MSYDDDPVQNDARRARRQRQLGEGAVCVLCGEEDPAALVAGKATLIEQHHVVGRQHEPALTAPLCRNCHAKQTETLRRAGVPMKRPRDFLERLVAILRALGLFLQEAGKALLRWADELAHQLTHRALPAR
jgi:hypothetical protein